MQKQIILVEDDPKARAALSMILLQDHNNLLSCYTAEQALENLQGSHPDVAILDVRLPGMSGDQLAEKLRTISPSTRIIFVTAEFDATNRLRRAVPGCTVMTKPIDVPGLLGMVA